MLHTNIKTKMEKWQKLLLLLLHIYVIINY